MIIVSWFLADDDDWSNTEFVSALSDVAMQPYRRVTSGPPLASMMFGTHEDFTASVESAQRGPQLTNEELAAWGVMTLVPGFSLATFGAWTADFLLWRNPVVVGVTAPAASANIVYEISQALDENSSNPNVKHGPSMVRYWAESGNVSSGGTMPVLGKWW